ncbi:unnamed protein product [Mytilus edulis]|uniref:YqaJ viral recombinase domain-containing protein n=1 Tax=Mytilus edulis TaxID=6550 RepID=A0A8S3RDT6_MYTED|nr:unnamed protein product [Mytilus edulis]
MGFKNTSQITFGETVQGSFNPTEADINFAVPDIKILRNFQPYNSTKNNIREPGIFTDIMHDIANSLQDTSACLSFDGKKLKQGLSGTHGDINLLGFEDGVSLYEKQKKLEAELSMVYEIIGEIQANVKMVGLNDIPQDMKADIVSVLQEVLKLLGLTAKSLRKIKEKKLYAKAKFIERSAPGSDWKNGQYVYVISSINAFLYEIDSFFWHYDITLEKLLSVLSSLNGCSSMYIGGYHFKLDDHQNFKPLADIETDDTRLVKQRSSKWFEIRQTAKVTGSSIYAALGLDGLKKMQDHFDQVVCHVPPKERSAEVQSFLDYGTKHEIYAVATLVGKILPSLYPGLVYYEEGCIAIQYEEQNFMVVSPDGSLRSENGTNDICGIEITCPVKQMHNEVPVRYLLQCMCEMEVLQVDKLLYICWMPDITSVFEIRRNDDLFLKVLDILLSIYGNEKPKRPTKLPEGIGQLRAEVQIDCKKAIFCGEFPSISNIDNDCVNMTEATKTDSLEVLQQVAELIKDGYELKRERASEAMVFLCCDLDRNWSKDQIRWAPVCWFPKGYSLTTNVFRNIVENVHNQCHTAGVHIPCSSFDGQWHNLAVRDKDGKPLTMLQLQKDVWQENCRLQKNEIIKWLCAQNCTVKLSKSENGAIFLTNGGTSLPILSKRALQTRIEKRENENQQSKEDDNQIIPQSECIPEQIIRVQMDTIDEGQNEVLAHLPLDSEAAHELESCNTANTVLVEDSDAAECADDISHFT